MFRITKEAEGEFIKTLTSLEVEQDSAIRLKRDPDIALNYVMVIDKAGSNDIKKTNKDGRVIFVIQKDLILDIDKITLDYQNGRFRFV